MNKQDKLNTALEQSILSYGTEAEELLKTGANPNSLSKKTIEQSRCFNHKMAMLFIEYGWKSKTVVPFLVIDEIKKELKKKKIRCQSAPGYRHYLNVYGNFPTTVIQLDEEIISLTPHSMHSLKLSLADPDYIKKIMRFMSILTNLNNDLTKSLNSCDNIKR